MNEWLARGGRLRTAVTFGLSFGLVMGATWFAFGHSADAALNGVVSGVTGAVVFGALTAVTRWPSWPGGEHVSPSNRRVIVGAVHRGEPVPDPRLAPDVVSYAKVVSAAAEREQRLRWVFFALPVMALALAVGETAAGSARPAVYSWVLTVLFLGVALLIPRSTGRRRKNAAEAIRLAGEHVNRPSAS
jgi:hypothetical protein